MEFFSLYETPLGTGAVVSTQQGVSRVCLPGDPFVRDLVDSVSAGGALQAGSAAELLQHYFMGVSQPFDSIQVDLSACTDFQRRILTLIRSIPFGEIQSYGQVADLAGLPGGARAIGGALASNPIPLIIPCHRIVAASGLLTGFSAPGGLSMKKYLLKMEGVEFKGVHTVKNINVINR